MKKIISIIMLFGIIGYSSFSHGLNVIEYDNIEINDKSDSSFIFNFKENGRSENIRETFYQETEEYLIETIDDLIDRKILSYKDIKTLNKKITVSYIESCVDTEGVFIAKRDNLTNKILFNEIELSISYCEKNDTPERNLRHTKQILAHEIGHYLYYFRDKNTNQFTEICRENGERNCLPRDFVSSYAITSYEEDYAESFAYRYLKTFDDEHNSAPLENPINRRERHFRRLFEEIEEEEEDDENEDNS